MISNLHSKMIGWYIVGGRYLEEDDVASEEFGEDSGATEVSEEKTTMIPEFIFVVLHSDAMATASRPTTNYTTDEVRNLLDIMENILPIGSEEWDQVVAAHATDFAGRDVNSIRRKYSTLYRKQIPTGDPNMPPEVRQAKRIKYLIGRKADLGDGEELYELQENAFQATARGRRDDPPLHQPSQEEEEKEEENTDHAVAAGTSMNDSTLVSTSASTSVSTNRSYRKAQNHEQFLELMRMQMQQDAEERRKAMEEREADRKIFRDSVAMMMTGLGVYLSGKKKKKKSKKRKRDDDDNSSSSSSDSD